MKKLCFSDAFAFAFGFRDKTRHGVFTKEVNVDLRAIFTERCLDFEAELTAFDGEADHLHQRVNSLKGVSSPMMGQQQ